MDQASMTRLEFDKIREHLKSYALSKLARRMIDEVQPSADVERVRVLLEETHQARILVNQSSGSHPLSGLHDITECLERVSKGGILHPEDLMKVADVLRGCSKVKKYMRLKKHLAPVLASYAESITEFPAVVNEVENSVAGSTLIDSASATLSKIRNQMRSAEERIKSSLHSVLTSHWYRDAIQENFITEKSGHYVIAVKASHKNMIPGALIASSASGATVFIEPAAVRRWADELRVLEAAEQAEEYQILMYLTALVAEHLSAIRVSLEVLAHYDLVFARARYAEAIGAIKPCVDSSTIIDLKGARHPLLGQTAVPLDLRLGERFQTLVITGPNTGGKSVVLKTIGLLCLMSQCGMHVPAVSGTRLGVFREVLADIGDSQSIEHSLSTFSSHVGNIARMIKAAGPGSLVLLDEVGTGTDPAEGAALACALMADLQKRGAITVATTHYGDVKRFSEVTSGFINGCMEFDPETLRPLYQLTVGKAGESNGLWIAQNLGIPPHVIEMARSLANWQNPLAKAAASDDSEPRVLQTTGAPADAQVAENTQAPVLQKAGRVGRLCPGDAVFVHTLRAKGVVVREADDKGNIVVMVRGEHVTVNHRRLKLIGRREDLYPNLETYDLNIVLLTKQDRKLVNTMKRKHSDTVRIITPPDTGR